MNKLKKGKEKSIFRTSRFERALHINEMQSRAFNNRMEVMESKIRKKLKCTGEPPVEQYSQPVNLWFQQYWPIGGSQRMGQIIENERHHAKTYLHFIRSSSGNSPFSLAHNGKEDGREDTPRIRPSTAGVQRLKFGCDGNSSHSYMSSDRSYGWPSYYYDNENTAKNARAKSAHISRERLNAHRTIMARVKKVEGPLQKRVSWIDGGEGGDEGLRGYSSVYRSPRSSLISPSSASAGTQYEPGYVQTQNLEKEELENEPSSRNSEQKSAKKKREVVNIRPINVTFPFAVTPDRYQSNVKSMSSEKLAGNQFFSHDRRKSVSSAVTSLSPRKSSIQLGITS